MKRFCTLFAWLAVWLLWPTGHVCAQEAQTWSERYAQARAAMLREDWAQAARELDALSLHAPSREQRLLSEELASLAHAKLERRVALAGPSLRTNDELTVLYATAAMYGLGTSAWLALQVEPNNVLGALWPFAVLTPAAIGIVAWADSYRPMRRGIPHAIAAGMYLGFGEGLWLSAYQSAYAAQHDAVEHWGAQRVSTALWLTATAGGLAGAAIGAINRPTPGRVSLTASAAMWSGALGAFVAHALESHAAARAETTFFVGAVTYNLGLLGGIVFGPVAAPSVKRVRYMDLAGLFGAILVGGSYALIASDPNSRVGLGLAAVGGTVGLGVGMWATRSMPADRSNDALPPVIGRRVMREAALQPSLLPTRGGFIAGLSGEL